MALFFALGVEFFLALSSVFFVLCFLGLSSFFSSSPSSAFFRFLVLAGVSLFLGVLMNVLDRGEKKRGKKKTDLKGDSIQAGRPRLPEAEEEEDEDGVIGAAGFFGTPKLDEGVVGVNCSCLGADCCWDFAEFVEYNNRAATCLHFPFEYSPVPE